MLRCGDFDQDVLAPLAAACEAAVGDGEVAEVVVDVCEVGFADSASLNELLRLPTAPDGTHGPAARPAAAVGWS
ncbi:hypothetical protein ACFV7Q_11105 [Streptomyces sp. NPDC059851]|uniref:hypothetical protein n=1 Tax=Streptomyces sp. NPDC059851 TaxID=3346971 RepID=UPI003650F51F